MRDAKVFAQQKKFIISKYIDNYWAIDNADDGAESNMMIT